MSGRDPFMQTGWPGVRGRLFHLYFLFSRPVTFGVRGIVLDEMEQSVFLIRHTYVPGWQLPGGGVEVGESAHEALVRELLEEGNIRVIEKPELRSLHFNRSASRRDHVAVFVVRNFQQIEAKAADREIAEAAFFPIDRLPEATTPGTKRRIAELCGTEPLSPYW